MGCPSPFLCCESLEEKRIDHRGKHFLPSRQSLRRPSDHKMCPTPRLPQVNLNRSRIAVTHQAFGVFCMKLKIRFEKVGGTVAAAGGNEAVNLFGLKSTRELPGAFCVRACKISLRSQLSGIDETETKRTQLRDSSLEPRWICRRRWRDDGDVAPSRSALGFTARVVVGLTSSPRGRLML